MEKKLIFISCGQLTPEEKELGSLIKALVDGMPGYEGYFAEHVHCIEALSTNVLDALRRCCGFIAFLHDRGTVMCGGKEWGHRSSVWVNQEIAILAYRSCLEGKPIPSLVFTADDLRLEGAMTNYIINPERIVSKENVLSRVTAWMAIAAFVEPVADGLFAERWGRLS